MYLNPVLLPSNKIILWIQRSFFILFLICSLSDVSLAQNNFTLSARVDTFDVENREVLNLWMNYLYSKPDSIYINPYWNDLERVAMLEAGMTAFDFGAIFMFRGGYDSGRFLREFHPTILSIDKLNIQGEEVYNIKTLFYSDRMAKDLRYADMNPPYITSYFCRKVNDQFKLTNAFPLIISEWQQYNFGFIKYFVHPSLKFDLDEAEIAIDYCDAIVNRFDLPMPDSISYVVAPNVNVMGQLYNFDYCMSYSTGITHTPLNTIVLSNPNFSHYHELIHIIFQDDSWGNKGRPFIINEGLATYLAGSNGENNFLEELISFSKEIQNISDLTLSDIISRKYSHSHDNIPIYVTGGFIFKLVDEKYGKSGVLQLFNCGRQDAEFHAIIEELFEMPFEEFDSWIIDQLKAF